MTMLPIHFLDLLILKSMEQALEQPRFQRVQYKEIIMNAPQIIMIVLYTISVFTSLMKHGESKGDYNFWASLIAVVIEAAILKWGGFWN